VRGRRVQPDRPANGRGTGSFTASAGERQVPDGPERRPRERRHPPARPTHLGVRAGARKDRRGREAGRRSRLVQPGASAPGGSGRSCRVDRGSGSRAAGATRPRSGKLRAGKLSRSTDRRMKRWPEPPGRFGAPMVKATGSRRHPRERRPLPRGVRASARTPRTRRDRRGRPRPARWTAEETPRCFGTGKRPELPPRKRLGASAPGNGHGGPPRKRLGASAPGNGPRWTLSFTRQNGDCARWGERASARASSQERSPGTARSVRKPG
jgi:hypothetical protein